MKIRDIITESNKEGTVMHGHAHPQQGILKMRDVGGYDRVYHMNRMMMAAAMVDASGKIPKNFDSSSWIEKFNSGHPFTEEEYKMLLTAMKMVPTDSKIIQKWSKSQEVPQVNKVSPVATIKKNKYGV